MSINNLKEQQNKADKYHHKTSKPNISLFNISDFKNSGLIITIKKLISEISFTGNNNINKSITFSKNKNSYQDILSVIICTCREEKYSKAAALSINDSISDKTFKNYEIVIVNNSDKTFSLEGFPKSTKLIDVSTPGLSLARNAGANAAKGEYLLYLDDDAIANPKLLQYIYKAFKKRKNYGVIGGQIFLELPTPIPKIFLKGRESLWSAYTVPYKTFKQVHKQYELPYGACFGVRHSAFDTIGGFPVNYGRCGENFAGGEETALCLLMQNTGYKIGVEPKASVIHNVDPKRFTKIHVQNTILAGITTTYRLSKDGYLNYIWTYEYINKRIDILNQEINRLNKKLSDYPLFNPKNTDYNNLINSIFYKECEIKAFKKVLTMM